MARNLRVVRIDDRAGRLVPVSDYSPFSGDGVIFAPLDLMVFEEGDQLRLGIKGLESAEGFWTAFRADQLPDIVIGDVDFEIDKSSPLQSWKVAEQNIPTGLSHLKPFAAVARASGKPLAVVIHTADVECWEIYARNLGKDRPDSVVFGLLAAHEVIELAAILGERIVRTDHHDLAPVWRWLKTRTESTPTAVLPKALVDYRRQVVERFRRAASSNDPLALRVPLGARAELQAWCQQMARAPVALEESGIDIGLPLLYPDGRIDRINFASLFADVQNILSDQLPAECFDLTQDDGSVWLLKTGGLPRIGALVAAIGGIEEAVKVATQALKFLPRASSHLKNNLREIESSPIARGLTVLFRALEIYQADEIWWNQIWSDCSWDPVELKESDGTCSWIDSLEDWVDRIEQTVRLVSDNVHAPLFVEVETIRAALIKGIKSDLYCDLTNRLDDSAVAVHLDFLEQMGYVESRTCGEGVEYRTKQSQAGCGLRPLRPTNKNTKLSWESDRLPTALRDSLGFGAARGPGKTDNDSAVGQILYAAFLEPSGRLPNANTQAQKGREFLTAFERGEAPGWLVEICRGYSRTYLGWTEDRTWPKCIRIG